MKTAHLKLLLAIMLICQAIITIAVPAFPGLASVKQPDGSMISLYLKGDEKVHWMESEDGYTLMYDKNKTIVYAITDDKGDIMPSSVAARNISLRSSSENDFLKNIQKKLKYSFTQINTLRSIWEVTSQSSSAGSGLFRAAVGDAHAICALINFADKPLVKSKNDFEILMNQTGYSSNGAMGSVVDFYKENSYGNLDFKITVAGPYTVSKGWEYYGENNPSTGNDYVARVQEFAMEAANLAFKDPDIHPSDYDNDNDGFIDAFHIIYAGFGEEVQGSDPNCIWAHKHVFPAITLGTKKLNTYSCSPELRSSSGSTITHIGVICHELCHVFGAPDFYDANGETEGDFTGTGNWDLMAGGSWNGNGACPAHINMYQKIKFGWVNPVTLTDPKEISNMPNSAENAVAYRYNTSTSGEYFVLENRQKKLFDRYIPGTGLLIYHVSITDADILTNTVNNKHPQKVYPVCASANTNPTSVPSSYGSINSAGCTFGSYSGKTSFTDYTIPAATSWSGANTIKPLTEIKEQGGNVSFRFMMPDAEPVTNLQVKVETHNVDIAWNKPSDEVIGYNIYRNNLLLIKLMGKDNTSYSQINVSNGNYIYCVTAIYNGKESTPVCKEVKVVSQIDDSYKSVQSLEARKINNDKDIELKWKSPFISDWMTISGNLTGWVAYSTTQFSSIVRFTYNDLKQFQGSKLSKVRFSIYNLQCKYTVQVWLANIGYLPSGNPIVSQLVSNPSAPNNNFEVELKTPVNLESNKELWIGIQYEMNPMSAVSGKDSGPMLSEQNFIYMNNIWYNVSSLDNFNWFISGYMQFDSNSLKAPADGWLRSTTAAPTQYVIYRDNSVIAISNQSSYVDPYPSYGSHIYCVSIAYDDGKESEPVCVEAFSSNNTSTEPVNNLEREIEVYPNPIQRGESLIIRFDSQLVSMLSLFNSSGQLIQQEQITGGTVYQKMDFEPGIYLLQIKNNSNTLTRKIIIR